MKHNIKMENLFAKLRTRTTFIFLIVAMFVCPSVRAKTCVKMSQCICEFDDGSGTVDITSIGKQDGTPLMQDVYAVDGYAYSFNPCFPFTEGTCVNVASCQIDMTGSIYYNIGDSAKVEFAYDGANVIGTYTADDDARTSIVTYICDPDVDPPQTVAGGETAPSQYSFSIVSKYACPIVPSTPTPSPKPTPTPADVPPVIVLTNVTISSGHLVSVMVSRICDYGLCDQFSPRSACTSAIQSIVDTPNCTCGAIETTSHFLLQCNNYRHIRQQYLENLPCPPGVDNYLFGKERLSFEENKHIFTQAHPDLGCLIHARGVVQSTQKGTAVGAKQVVFVCIKDLV